MVIARKIGSIVSLCSCVYCVARKKVSQRHLVACSIRESRCEKSLTSGLYFAQALSDLICRQDCHALKGRLRVIKSMHNAGDQF